MSGGAEPEGPSGPTERERQAPRSTSLLERLLPPVDQLDEDGQPKPSRMTPLEQQVAVGLGLANVAIAAVAASGMENQQAAALVAGLAAAAVTVVGGRVGHRMVAMLGLFACVVTRSTSTTVFFAFGVPYYGAALWMYFKYNKLVKARTVLRRQQRAQAKASGAPPSRSGQAKGTGAKDPAKARPNASKRYTPPKPPKKRPPPPPKEPRDRSIVD